VVDDDLTLEKVSVCVGDHRKSFLVLKSGRSGDKREAIVSVLVCGILWTTMMGEIRRIAKTHLRKKIKPSP